MRPRRKELGFTQQELADLVGVNRMTIVKYETGDYSPSLDTLDSIAVVLDCTSADLLTAPEKEAANG